MSDYWRQMSSIGEEVITRNRHPPNHAQKVKAMIPKNADPVMP